MTSSLTTAAARNKSWAAPAFCMAGAFGRRAPLFFRGSARNGDEDLLEVQRDVAEGRLPFLAEQQDVESAQRADRARQHAGAHLPERLIDLLRELTFLDPAQIAAPGGGGRFRKLAGQGSETCAGAQLLEEPFGAPADLVLL